MFENHQPEIDWNCGCPEKRDGFLVDLTLAQNPAMIAASTAKKRRNKLSEKTSNPLHKDSDLAKYQLQLGYPTSCEPQCFFLLMTVKKWNVQSLASSPNLSILTPWWSCSWAPSPRWKAGLPGKWTTDHPPRSPRRASLGKSCHFHGSL